MKLQQEHIDILIKLMRQSAQKENLANAGIVLSNNSIIASEESLVASDHDATAHSERLLVSRICKIKDNNYTPGLDMITVVEPCTMCLSACSQAGYASVNFIIPADFYIKRFPYITDGITLQEKQNLAQNFSSKIALVHLKEYEDMFRIIFDEAMKDLFIT